MQNAYPVISVKTALVITVSLDLLLKRHIGCFPSFSVKTALVITDTIVETNFTKKMGEPNKTMGKSYALANPTNKMGKSSREMGVSYQDTNPNFLIQNPFCIIFC